MNKRHLSLEWAMKSLSNDLLQDYGISIEAIKEYKAEFETRSMPSFDSEDC